jgi:trehalose 6-phosphate phosphatase
MGDALFLDFDGTLTEIAPAPDLVRFDAEARELVRTLVAHFAGAVAIISGRNMSEIDRHLAPLEIPVAGLYGLTRRSADGRIRQRAANGAAITEIAAELKSFADRHEGVLVERKGDTIALHYRARPDLEADARSTAQASVEGQDDLKLIEGKMVVEIAPAAADKGRAVREFLAEAPFAGRRPIYIGDDISDEAAFAVVRGAGGIAIKVGSGPTLASYCVRDTAAVFAWLRSVVN